MYLRCNPTSCQREFVLPHLHVLLSGVGKVGSTCIYFVDWVSSNRGFTDAPANHKLVKISEERIRTIAMLR